MKKFIVVAIAMMVSVATSVAADKTPGARVWGNGITIEVSKGWNFKNKVDYIAFMRSGTAFLSPTDQKAFYINHTTGQPISYAAYKVELPVMQEVHNTSIRAFFDNLNTQTGGKLGKKYGLSNFGTIEDVIKVFESDRVYYDVAPTGEEIPYDGVNVDAKTIYSLPRFSHVKLGSGEAEGGWWIDLRDIGYKPMYFKSAFCNNTVSTSWIRPHLIAIAPIAPAPAPGNTCTTCKQVPQNTCTTCATLYSNGPGNTTTKPIIAAGPGNATTTPNYPVQGGQSTPSAGPKSSEYDF